MAKAAHAGPQAQTGNDAYTQTALANDGNFRQRVSSALSAVAWEVTVEDPGTANHAAREGYARQVIRSLQSEVNIILPTFVMRPNVLNFPTTYDFDWVRASGFVATAATDADLQSQLHSDWDAMAEAAGFSANGTMMRMPPMPPH